MNYLRKNIDLLQKRDPLLAEYIVSLKKSENVSVVKSSSGARTLIFADHSGQTRFLHSPQDPISEAKRLLKGYSFKREDGTLLFGFGLGYLVKEIIREKEPHHLLCVAEGIPEIFKTAMEHIDLSEILADEDVHFFIGDMICGITDDFKPIQLKAISGSINKLAIPGFMELYNGLYDDIEKKLHDHVTSLRVSFNTFLHTRELSLSNLFNNIPAIISATEVDNLKGLIKGKPALIIAAGPSLTGNIDAIRKRPTDCFTICVDTALKPLIENGVQPDLVVTCDPNVRNYEKVAGLSPENLASIPLLFRADTEPNLIKRFKGIKFIAHSDTSLANWVVNIGRKVITLPRYQTVSHLGFLTACIMGADPIILVGLDLSFPNDKDHAEGSPISWNLDFKKNPFKWVPSTNGGMVKTCEVFVSMIHLIENEVKKTPARCINISRNGALIKGTEWMPLEKALRSVEDNTESDRAIFFQKRLAGAFNVDSNTLKTKHREALTWMSSEAKNLGTICQEAKDLLDPSEDYKTGEYENQENLEQLIELQKAAFKHKLSLNILSDYLPRYLLSFCKTPKEGIPEVEISPTSPYQEQLNLFFKELGEVLPLLEEHCLKALGLTQK